jgi:hypothetical protein
MAASDQPTGKPGPKIAGSLDVDEADQGGDHML